MRYQKHSYTIDLKGKFPLGNLPRDDDWILNANYIDKTFMRHKLSYDLFRAMGDHNIAPLCTYVKLILNDRYSGLYVLMEKMDASTLNIDKTDSLAMIFKDPPIFYRERLKQVQDPSNYFLQKYPKIKAFDKTPYIQAFQDFLFQSSDDLFAQQIGRHIDLQNIMDWHLLLLLSNNSDGIMKNFYLYKQDQRTPFRVAIWDYDHSFGRDGDNELNMLQHELKPERSILIKRLLQIESLNYTAQLKNRWFELRRSGLFTEAKFIQLIRQNHYQIREELGRNFEHWPVDAKWYYDAQTYAQEINLMIRFIGLRLKQLDQRFAN